MPSDIRITADELKRRMQAGEAFIVLDTRNPNAWAEARDKARGALRIPADASEPDLQKLPKDKPIVAYCT